MHELQICIIYSFFQYRKKVIFSIGTKSANPKCDSAIRSANPTLTIPRRLFVGERQKLVRIAIGLQSAQHRNHDGRKGHGQSQIEQQQILGQTGEELGQDTAEGTDLILAVIIVRVVGMHDAVAAALGGNPAQY